MAGEELNRILDDLDQQMLDDYDEYAMQCVEGWVGFQGNNGQMVILAKYIIPAAEEHAHHARIDWPKTAGPAEYREAIYGSFDSDVIAQAFSDTIEDIIADLTDYWDDAMFAQEEHEFVEGGGENAGPHSTHQIWRGGPYGTTIY